MFNRPKINYNGPAATIFNINYIIILYYKILNHCLSFVGDYGPNCKKTAEQQN